MSIFKVGETLQVHYAAGGQLYKITKSINMSTHTHTHTRARTRTRTLQSVKSALDVSRRNSFVRPIFGV